MKFVANHSLQPTAVGHSVLGSVARFAARLASSDLASQAAATEGDRSALQSARVDRPAFSQAIEMKLP